MFQNEKIAKAHGFALKCEAIKRGVSEDSARELGKEAAATKLAEMDAWVLANVNLD